MADDPYPFDADYCARMMLGELSRLRPALGDTRCYLSLDKNDKAVLEKLLKQFLLDRQAFQVGELIPAPRYSGMVTVDRIVVDD